MGCPLFSDDGRDCQKHFKKIVDDVELDFCCSEEYLICPLYKIIIEKQPYCEHIQECTYRLHRIDDIIRHNTDLFKKIMHLVFYYCLSEKKEECERYKRIINGKKLSNDLLQNGDRISIRDLIPNECIKITS